tara:strand:+ start:6069 stop:6527 length:459 start_codon:yes stop_codon:yes gene_type:complete
MENDMSIDNVSPQEWDAYNKRYIQRKKDSTLKNPPGMSDQDVMDEMMGKDRLSSSSKYNHQTKHIENVASQLNDNVNSPVHYNSGNVECIEAIEAMLSPQEFIGYLRGNSLKYRWRFLYKGKPIEDLEKADWYELKLYNFFKENESVLGQKG